jgi:hypothetical protein
LENAFPAEISVILMGTLRFSFGLRSGNNQSQFHEIFQPLLPCGRVPRSALVRLVYLAVIQRVRALDIFRAEPSSRIFRPRDV